MSDYPFNPFMDDYSLKENQHKIAEAIYNDYSVLKFGAFGEKYLYAVCDYDVRKYNSLRRRPDFRQFIADKDKHYRRLMSILMVKANPQEILSLITRPSILICGTLLPTECAERASHGLMRRYYMM